MKITKLSIQRSSLVVVVFTALTVLGWFTYRQLSYELLPDFSIPVVAVSTIYPGAAPAEVEQSVTKVIEDAVASLENIDKITSTSQESYSVVVVELKPGTDVDLALQDAQRKINAILADLPDDADPPALAKFDINDLPIMRLGVNANLPETELIDLIDNRIQPLISQVAGVAQVNIQGGSRREIQVNIDKNRMEAFGLTPLQIQQAISAANLDFPTGKIENQDGQILVRLAGKFTDVSEIGNLIVTTGRSGSPVRVRDVAEVLDGSTDVEILSRIDGKNSIGLSIQKQTDANGVAVAEQIRALLTELETTYSNIGLHFEIAQDSSDFTLAAADAVIHDLMIAVVLVAAVMLLFLHSIRNAIIVMIAVPASIIATFIFMYLAGFTLNLMSLLALSLVVGILVDDAIVVIENIHRHMEMGKSAIQASFDGIREIGATVVSITLVIVIVFVPIALTEGMISGILRQFSLTVAVATLLSLLVAFTLIPLLTSRFARHEEMNPNSVFGKFLGGFERGIDWVIALTTDTLKWAFRHRILVLTATTLLFFSSFFLLAGGFIGSEFVSEGDRSEFIVGLELPKDATVEQTNFTTRQAELLLGEYPEVTSIFTTVGISSSFSGGGQAQPYISEMNVKLVDRAQRSLSAAQFAQKVKIDLQEKLVNAKVTAIPVSMLGTADEAPIQIVLVGPELDTLMAFSDKVLDIVNGIPGTVDVETSIEEGNPEVRVVVDRTKMAELGLSMQQVGVTMQMAFSGNTDAKYRDGDNEYDINIRLDKFDRRSVNDIASLTFTNMAGQQVQLQQFADVEQSEGPSKLERLDRITSMMVKARVVGRPTGTVGTEIQEAMAGVDVPNEVQVRYEGQMANQAEAFGNLGFAFVVSILFVYLIMVALYDNYVYPFVVLFSLPLAMIGAIYALALAQENLSIFSLLGIIMLVGLVAKNAILLVDFTNQLRATGMETREALINAMQVRFRPILMTTLAMIFGMLPIALATGAGAEWKNGLAWALIGGLVSSMFLTLVVIPVIYDIFTRIMERVGLGRKKDLSLDESPLASISSEIESLHQHYHLPPTDH